MTLLTDTTGMLALQIVVVGASEAALSCLEHLLCSSRSNAGQPLAFTSLTLLAPGGISVAGGPAGARAPALLARAGLHAAVTVVDAALAALDCASKVVVLEDGSQLHWDHLVLATGLQVRGWAGCCSCHCVACCC